MNIFDVVKKVGAAYGYDYHGLLFKTDNGNSYLLCFSFEDSTLSSVIRQSDDMDILG